MFKELENLVYTNDEQMKKTQKSATIGFNGLRISAKVAEGKELEEILKEKEMVR